MESGSRQSRRQHRCFSSIALALCWFLFSSLSVAQTATIDFVAERDFVYQDGVYETIGESILPFVATVSNPGSTTIEELEFTVTLTSGVSVGNVDSECVVSEESAVVLSCTIDELKANRSKVIDFYVDGPNSLEVGAGFDVTLTSAEATVLEPDSIEATLADGNRRVRGAARFVHLVRNIDLDIDQDNVPDLDEAIMNLPASTSTEDLLARPAVVDVLFVYSPAAGQYLGTKLDFKTAQIISIANQLFRENEVAIRFKRAGLEEIAYTANDNSILTTFDALVAKSHQAFDALDVLIAASGGDIVVMLHALDANLDSECGWTTLNAVGRQGDFRSSLHRGKLLSAINVGPSCLNLRNLAPLFASNMGIARERERSPDGGTFSYSAAHGVAGEFSTLGAAIGTHSFGSATPLNRFSNPDALCLGMPCGVERADIAAGADAVYSLNKTRHLVSAITPTIFHVEPDAIEEKISLLDDAYDLEVMQTSLETSAIVGEFTEIEVTVSNNSSATLSDIDLQLAHVNAGSIVDEAHLYETSSSLCTILGSALADTATQVGEAVQKVGTLTCSIDSIAPGESLSFSYRIQIDATPPLLNNETYYHEVVTVNGTPQLESLMCLPVFLTFVDANAGSSVCDEVQNLALSFGPLTEVSLSQVASVTGNRLSVPFIRLDDGSLISAEFQITYVGAVRFELLSYQTLDSTLTPLVEARFTDAGVLSLSNLLVNSINYDIDATLEPGSDPVTLGALNITAQTTDP